MIRSAALVLLVLPLAACGGGSKTSSAGSLDAVKSAAQKTLAAGSEALSLRANVAAAGQAVVLDGTGSFSTKSPTGSLRLHVNAGPVTTTLDEVVAGTAIYLRSPLLTGNLPAGKTWVGIDVSKLKVTGVDLQSLLAQNPANELKYLQELKTATKVGREQVDGVSATHYKATIDTTKLPAAAKVGISTYDVWVGDDGYIHRVQLGTVKPATSVRVDLSNFGVKVTATPPPAAQVYETNSIPGLGVGP